jgi:hypothetical protein
MQNEETNKRGNYSVPWHIIKTIFINIFFQFFNSYTHFFCGFEKSVFCSHF